jgi:Icc protein
MSNYIWLTDTHLNFLESYKIVEFFLELKFQEADGIFLTGDISNGPNVCKHLRWLQKILDKPVYFVLGNHDYYRSSFEEVEQSVTSLVKSNESLHYLSVEQPISLNGDTALIGHNGWYDAKWHDPLLPVVFLADWYFIDNFKLGQSNKARMQLMRDRASEAAKSIGKSLQNALRDHSTVYLLTHFPPWPYYQYGIRDNFWKPFNSSRIIAETIEDTMKYFPNKKLIVLAGHTHEVRYTRVAPNIELRVARAELKKPSIGNIVVI